MKIKDILTSVGKSIISNVIPGAGVVFDAVEAVTGKSFDKETTTGEGLIKEINNLPPDQQSSLLEKQLDVDVIIEQEWTKRFEALNKADSTGKSTRPKIALMMAWCVVFTVVVLIGTLGISIALNNLELVGTVNTIWPLALAILGTPTALLYAYFGMRKKEKEARYQLANNEGQSVGTGVLGSIAGIISNFKK